MKIAFSISDARSRVSFGLENEGSVPESSDSRLLAIVGSFMFLGAGVGLERVWSLLVGVLRIRF